MLVTCTQQFFIKQLKQNGILVKLYIYELFK
jgi:hypothetical protein